MDKVVHFEIPCDDYERAINFYTDVFGWKFNDVPNMNYKTIFTSKTDKNGMIKEKGAINGGLFKRKNREKPIIIINVNSIDEYLDNIRKMGGRTGMPIQKIANMGHYARFVDSEGNIIGLWQSNN